MSAASTKNIWISGTTYSIPPYFKGCSEQTNWDALGEAMISKLVEEVSGVNEVDFRFGKDSASSSRRRRKGEKACTWEFVHEKHSVMVFRKKLTDSRLCFMGRGIIDKPLAEVAEFIKQVENNMTWDCFLIEAKYLQVIHESPLSAAYVGYQRYETKKCMMSTKRDLLFYARCSHQGDRYIQAGLSIKSSDFPCPPGVKRIEVGPGSGWIMEKVNGSNSRTLVTYVANVDLKGIPIFIMNMIIKRHPLAVHFVRRQMIDPSGTARPRCSSSATRSSDDSDDDWSLYQSIDLPDDFVPNDDRNSSTIKSTCHTPAPGSMLKPPPASRLSLDREALESEGRARYLTALEKKLDRLQGSDKRSITSKNIMSSLSEARDDHMRQTQVPMAYEHQTPEPMDRNVTTDTVAHDSCTNQIPEPSDLHTSVHCKQEPISNDPWRATSDSGVADDRYKGEDEVPQFEVFVGVELEKSCCCACFRPRRQSSAPRIRERTVEGGGLSNGGDSLWQVDPLGNAGNVKAMRIVGGDLRRASPVRSAGQGTSLRSAGLSLRGIVGLGKPRKPEDGLTLEEEREFLLKCDQLEMESNY